MSNSQPMSVKGLQRGGGATEGGGGEGATEGGRGLQRGGGNHLDRNPSV